MRYRDNDMAGFWPWQRPSKDHRINELTAEVARLEAKEAQRIDYEYMEQKLIIDRQTAMLNQPVIHVPNEWQDMTIATVMSFENDRGTKTFLYDVIDQHPCFILGEPIPYTRQMLDALLKLDPFERWILCLPKELKPTERWEKEKSKTLTPPEEIYRILETRDWFNRFPQ